jgi:TctA family transporter
LLEVVVVVWRVVEVG